MVNDCDIEFTLPTQPNHINAFRPEESFFLISYSTISLKALLVIGTDFIHSPFSRSSDSLPKEAGHNLKSVYKPFEITPLTNY